MAVTPQDPKTARDSIVELLSEFGQTITRVRPADDVNPSDTQVYKGQIETVRGNFFNGYEEQGGWNWTDADHHAILFDYTADIHEGDLLRYDGMEYRVMRWEPTYIGDFLISQTCGCARSRSLPGGQGQTLGQ